MSLLLRERKLNRLRSYDYSQVGSYYLTICTKNKEEFFGGIRNGKMVLNKYGMIISQQWNWLFKQYLYINKDEYIIMPNHFHAVMQIHSYERGRDRSRPVPTITIKHKSLSELIGAFKTTSSKQIHNLGCNHFLWQRLFYDRIIRNECEYIAIRQYILDNPKNWLTDRNNANV